MLLLPGQHFRLLTVIYWPYMQYFGKASGCQGTVQAYQVIFVGNMFWLDQ